MDRMAASNRSIRMKHGTTALHIMVPLNRNTRFSITEQNALQASSSHMSAQWMSPSSPSSLTVTTSYRVQVPILPQGSRFSAPPYNFPPPYITPSNMSTTSKFPKRSQYPIPPYVPPCSCPPYTTQSSMPVYTSLSPSLTNTSHSSTTSNTSQTSNFSKKSQYPTPPYIPPYSCPPYTTQSFMPVYTSLSPSLTNTSHSSTTSNTSQTSKSSIRSQSSATAYNPRYPTLTDSTAYSVPAYTSRSPMSFYNMSPSLRMGRRSLSHFKAYPSYSHYTFPRSVHYTMPIFNAYRPQSNLYLSSTNDSSINVWPTKTGSVMQISMEDICFVLATQIQKASQPSTTARADLIARQVNGQSLKCVNPNPSKSTKTSSNSSARNHSEKSEETLMPLYKKDNEDIDTQLRNAWVYFNKMEIVDIKPNGEIKCICPVIQFEDLLKLSIKDKRILVNLYRHYEINNLLFETKYDYNSSPQNTIASEKMENEVLQWLISLEMEEYDWFFNSLSLYEIENISPTNIQKFITRSKSNKTISIEDQLKICCIVKKTKEWPVSLIAIAMNLQENRFDDESFVNTVHPYIYEIFLFQTSITKHFLFEDIMNESFIRTMITLQFYLTNVYKKKTQPDTNSNMGDSLDIEMVATKETWKHKKKCEIR